MTNSQLCLPSPICSVTGCHARALQSTSSLSPAPLCTSVHNFQSAPFLSVSSIHLKVAFGRPLGFLLSSGALPASTGHFVPGACDVSTSLRRLYAPVFTAPFNNMRTLTFKAQPTNAFFATVNQVFGDSSQLPTTFERAVIKSLSTVQITKQCSAVVRS